MENNQNVYYKVEVDAVVRGWGIESRSDEKTTPQQSGSRFKNELACNDIIHNTGFDFFF